MRHAGTWRNDLKYLERMILEHPGFGQGFAAGLEEGAQFNRVGPGDDEVELRPPMAGDAVGDCLDELVGAEGSARGRHDEIGLDAERELVQRTAEELDHELPHPLGARLAGLAAAAEPSRPYNRKLARIGLVGEPVQ